MIDIIQTAAMAFALRFLQALLYAAPTILFGLLTAGVLRRVAGPEGVRRLFGGSTWRALPRAWLLGMLLPVCSLGVLPVARELRRCGVPAGTVLAFALAAPLVNPLSFLYGLTLPDAQTIFAFVLASLLVSIVAGLMWTRWLHRDSDDVPAVDEPLVAQGPQRIVAVAVTAARELTSPVVGYMLIGLVGAGLLAAVLPHGVLQQTMQHDDPTSPLLMTGVALPAYIAPLHAMKVLGLMFEHGNSVGAAYMLLVFGAGANLGLLAWIAHAFGWRRAGVWLVVVTGVALALAYGMEVPLYSALREEAHTHAFDDFSSPFVSGSATLSAASHLLGQTGGKLELFGAAGLAALALGAATLRLLERRIDVEAWLRHADAQPAPATRWNRPIPPRALACVALAGLFVFSGVGAWLYYPAPEDLFAEMTNERVNAVVDIKTGRTEEAMRALRRWDELSRRLEVGVLLRAGPISEEARAHADALREMIEDLFDDLKEDRIDEARAKLPQLEAAYLACRRSFLGS